MDALDELPHDTDQILDLRLTDKSIPDQDLAGVRVRHGGMCFDASDQGWEIEEKEARLMVQIDITSSWYRSEVVL